MKLSDVPYKFQFQWAENASSGFVTSPIPPTTSAPAASQSLGFPPETAVPIAAGGTPPNIDDYNGAYQYVTAWAQWLQAGYPILYDATFQTNIGGYPQNAMVNSVAFPGVIWQSTVDDNTSDPDTGGANWQQYPVHGSQTYATPGTFTFTVPAGVTYIKARYWGGGGGGLGTSSFNCPGGGGGGGGYGENLCSVTPGESLTIVVGAGGTAGNQGGSTSITGTALSVGAAGGQGGQVGNSGSPGTSGNGGTATGNVFTFSGGGGNTIQPGGAGTFWISTAGPSFGCTPQQAAGSLSNTPAGPGQFPGGGSTGATGAPTGGTGGQVILEW